MPPMIPVTVMTYNVQGLSKLLLPVGNLSTRIEHIGRFVSKIVHKYKVDVLIIQELFSTKLYKKIKKCLVPTMPYDTREIEQVESSGWWGSFGRCILPFFSFIPSGVIIFSRHPIVDKRKLIFSDGVYADRLGSKAAVLVRLMVRQQPLDVVGIHLQSCHGLMAHKTRESQMTEFVMWLWSKRKYTSSNIRQIGGGHDVPLLLAGDFNTCIINDKQQTAELFRALSGVVEPTFGCGVPAPSYSELTNDFCDFQNNEGYHHIYDYIFASPDTTVMQPQTVVRDTMDTSLLVHRWFLWCIRTDERKICNASDHFPVYAVIGIETVMHE